MGRKTRQEKLREVFGGDATEGLIAVDTFFLDHIHRDLHRRGPGAFAGPGLKHVERTLLDGELDVLHLPIMLLKDVLGFE